MWTFYRYGGIMTVVAGKSIVAKSWQKWQYLKRIVLSSEHIHSGQIADTWHTLTNKEVKNEKQH